MTELELVAFVKGIAPAVRAAVVAGLKSFDARLTEVEARPLPVNGRDGAPGPSGEKGLDGAPGQPGTIGPVGPSGERGEKGERGERGEPGPVGANGEKGLQGERGPEGQARDGRDGLPGVQGPVGEKGLNGADGALGINGKDGRDGTLDNLKVLRIDERTVSLCFKDGTPIEGGILRFDVPLYRGVYVEGKAYETGDTVTWAGSTWHCNEPTTTKPGDGSKAWTMTVKRGRDGKDGTDAPGALPVVKVR